MKPADVPVDLMETAAAAVADWAHARPLNLGRADWDERTRLVLAAVLPEWERQIREQIAREIAEPSVWSDPFGGWSADQADAARVMKDHIVHWVHLDTGQSVEFANPGPDQLRANIVAAAKALLPDPGERIPVRIHVGADVIAWARAAAAPSDPLRLLGRVTDLTGIDVVEDDALPPAGWRLVDQHGDTIKEYLP